MSSAWERRLSLLVRVIELLVELVDCLRPWL
jgi:hypothetical protein